MTPANYAKLQDRPRDHSETGRRQPDDTALLVGTWVNTNPATTGIVEAVVASVNGALGLHVFGAGDPDPNDWGEVEVKSMFADGISSERAISFTAQYDFGFLETELQTNLAKGLLIITSLNTFKDDSGRSNYFSREYFFKKPVG